MHRVVEELGDPAILSKSATVGGSRRLSVMRQALMEGMAFMSGDSVVVVDLPAPPVCPSDVGDLGAVTQMSYMCLEEYNISSRLCFLGRHITREELFAG